MTILAGTLLCAAGASAVFADSSLEWEVKAAYMFKFPPFVEWPASAPSSAPFDICIVGEDPFGNLLDRAAAGQRIDGRSVVISRYSEPSPGLLRCQMMYVRGDPEFDAQALSAVRGAAVLTITDAAEGDPKGIVNFVISDNHVRFEIDIGGANRSRLGISSKLLNVALAVRNSQSAP
ncbi:MAG: YfiR family protein [Rhizomicrobium sp.]